MLKNLSKVLQSFSIFQKLRQELTIHLYLGHGHIKIGMLSHFKYHVNNFFNWLFYSVKLDLKSSNLKSRIIQIQWGSEIRPFKIHLKSRNIQNPKLLEGWISNGPFVVRFQMVPTIRKPEKCLKSSPFYWKINFLFKLKKTV